jgi:hypothetical protein
VLDHLEAADAESYSDCDIHLEVLVLDHLDYSDDNRSFTRESSDGKSPACLTTQQLRWALPLEAEAAALAAVLNTAMIRRQSELEGEQRRLGEHGSHATHHSLYQQRRRTWRPSRKVHRLLQCLDELEVSWACERASCGRYAGAGPQRRGRWRCRPCNTLLLLSAHSYIHHHSPFHILYAYKFTCKRPT